MVNIDKHLKILIFKVTLKENWLFKIQTIITNFWFISHIEVNYMTIADRRQVVLTLIWSNILLKGNLW